MKLNEIQKNLKAPKNQYNNFGKYKYRNCEDILEAVKPLLGEATLYLSDDIVEISGRIYVKATATFNDGKEVVNVSAFARESETKKGMDDSQITGSASSYARKYALNGLFLIDDTKDADTMDNSKKEEKKELNLATEEQVEKLKNLSQEDLKKVLSYYKIDSLEKIRFSQANSIISKKGL